MTRCLTRAAFVLALLLCAASAQAQSAAVGAPATPPTAASPDADVAESPPLVSLVLQRRGELQLSVQQVKDLESIRTDFRRQAIRNLADLRLAEIDRDELLNAKPLDMTVLAAKLKQIDDLKIGMHEANVDFAKGVAAKLTAAQRQKLEPLLAASVALPAAGEPNLRQEIRSALKEQFEQQDVVEIKTTQAIAARLLDWAKNFAIAVGVLVTLGGAAFAFVGVSTIKDLRTKAEGIGGEAEKVGREVSEKVLKVTSRAVEVENTLHALETRANSAKDTADSIDEKFMEALKRIDHVEEDLSNKVKELAKRVTRLEPISFKGEKLPPEQEQAFIVAILSFQEYFQTLDFTLGQKRELVINIDRDKVFDNEYDFESNTMILAPIIAADLNIVCRLYAHRALEHEAEANHLLDIFAYCLIESGLSLYFAASYRNKPTFAEQIVPQLEKEMPEDLNLRPQVRVVNLENSLKLDGIDINKYDQSLYEDAPNDYWVARTDGGEAWGGAFWEMRVALGKASADKLLFTAWRNLPPAEDGRDSFVTFVKEVLKADGANGGNHADLIKKLFANRGLQL